MTTEPQDEPAKVLPVILDKVLAFKPGGPSPGDTIPTATHGGPGKELHTGPVKIPCYVLADGTRVLSQRGIVNALGMARGSNANGGGDRLVKFATGKAISDYTSGVQGVVSAPISFRTTSGAVAYGYNATVLADLCEAILAARKAGALQKQQEHIAAQAEMLVRAFARVGIVALVDEATGFQKQRAEDDLQRLLAVYLSPERLKWTATFPEVYYKEIYRLWGWAWPTPNPHKRTPHVGKLTNQLVYEQLPPGVLEELRRRNPKVPGKHYREAKHHMELSKDIGQKDLQNHLLQVITIMKISSTRAIFWKNFKALFPGRDDGQQMLLEVEQHLEKEAEN